MLLSNEKKLRLKELSVDRSGVAFADKKSSGSSDPTVIISLGGLGGKTLNETKHKVISALSKDHRVFFLALDSDKTDLNNITSPTGYLDKSETEIIFDASCENILMRPQNRPSYINDWMVADFPRLSLDSNGAKARRQVGRAMLSSGESYKKVESKLNRKISDALESRDNATEQQLNVIIVSGISGGTGSGTIIDIGYLVRLYLENTGTTNYNIVSYIYMPDVQYNVRGIRQNDSVKKGLQRNAYAALKEIDYFMNLENFNGQYCFSKHGGKITCDRNIFDSCTIISGMTAHGMHEDSESMAINTVAESILSLVSDITYENNGQMIQMSRSFMANAHTNMETWFPETRESDFPRSANYNYQIIGHASINIPKAEIISYCAHILFEELIAEFKSHNAVTQEVVDGILDECGFGSVRSLLSKATRDMGVKISLSESKYPTKKQLKNESFSGTQNVARSLAESDVNKIKNYVTGDFGKNAISAIKASVDQKFGEVGPFYALALYSSKIRDGHSIDGILAKLENLQDEIADHVTSADSKIRNGQANRSVKNAQADVGKQWGSAKDAIRNYVKACEEYEKEYYFDLKLLDAIKKELREIGDFFVKENNEIYFVYTQILEQMSKVLENDATYITDSKRTDSGEGERFSYDVINLYDASDKKNRLIAYLKDFVSASNVKKLSQEFIKSMRDQRDRWIGEGAAFSAEKAVQEIFTDFFDKELKDDTIEKFLVVAFSDDNLTIKELEEIWKSNPDKKAAVLQKAAQEIARLIETHSATMAKLVSKYSAANFLSSGFIGYLKETPQLNALITQNFGSALGLQNAASSSVSTIVCSRLYYGVPLYAIRGLDEIERTYEELLPTSKGVHMDEVTEKWSEFPEPLNADAIKTLYDEDSIPKRETEILQGVRRLVDDSIAKGYIYLTDDQSPYRLAKIKSCPDDMNTLYENVRAVRSPESYNLVEVLKNSGFTFEEIPLEISDNYLRINDVGDKYRIGDLHKIVRMNMYFKAEIEKASESYKDILDKIDETLQAGTISRDFTHLLTIFKNAIKTEVIWKDDSAWYYNVDSHNEELIDFEMKPVFEREMELYCAFCAMCRLHMDDIKLIETLSQERGKEKIKNQSAINEVLENIVATLANQKYLGTRRNGDEVRQKVNDSKFDYDVYTEAADIGDPYKLLLHFYTKAKEEFQA